MMTVELAPAGVTTLDELEGQGREMFGRLLATLTVAELEQLRGGFAALSRAGQSITSASKPDDAHE